jgi:hypothetical protein
MYKKFINSTIPHTQYLICCDYDETILSIDSFEFDVEAAQTLPTLLVVWAQEQNTCGK